MVPPTKEELGRGRLFGTDVFKANKSFRGAREICAFGKSRSACGAEAKNGGRANVGTNQNDAGLGSSDLYEGADSRTGSAKAIAVKSPASFCRLFRMQPMPGPGFF